MKHREKPVKKTGKQQKLDLFKVLCILLISLTLVGTLTVAGDKTEHYELAVGEVSTVTIYAPEDVENTAATERAKQEALAKVENAYMVDDAVNRKHLKEIGAFFTTLRSVRMQSARSIQERASLLLAELPYVLTYDSYEAAVNMDDSEMMELEKTVMSLASTILHEGYLEADILSGDLEATIDSHVEGLQINQALRTLSGDILNGVLSAESNLILDEETTYAKRIEAAADVESVIVKKNMVIIDKGETVTEEHLAMLRTLGLIDTETKTLSGVIVAKCGLLAALYTLIGVYLYHRRDTYFRSVRLMILLNLLLVGAVAVGYVLSRMSIWLTPAFGLAAAMLMAILLDTTTATMFSMMMSVIFGLMLGGNYNIVLVTYLECMLGILLISRTQQRSRMPAIGLILAPFGMVIASLLMVIAGTEWVDILKNGLWSAGGAFSSIIAVIGLLPFLENGFKITTSYRLLELSNPNQPLLRRLMMEASGTYHHSVLVANMAEAAAEAVGGNGLLARVGAYYHDIGKMKRPGHFVENQMGGPNPHNKYTPALSTLIITSHVKDGYEMAREAKLPQEICDIIKQHHGDTLMVYFYGKAKEADPNMEVDEKAFRYEGPRPQTKEAGIIILADSCEAAVRSMSDMTQGKIEGLIRKIIKGKLDDGQLDQCDLTLKDLDTIARSFSKILQGVYHSRIEYPDLKKTEPKAEVKAETPAMPEKQEE